MVWVWLGKAGTGFGCVALGRDLEDIFSCGERSLIASCCFARMPDECVAKQRFLECVSDRSLDKVPIPEPIHARTVKIVLECAYFALVDSIL